MKKVKQLDDQGYVIGLTVADEDQLNPGTFILPFNSVDADLPKGFDEKSHRAKWDGEKFVIEDKPKPANQAPAPSRASDKGFDPYEYLERRARQIEDSGILVAGKPVATDDRTKLLILGKRLVAERNPEGTSKWKSPNGFVDIPHAFIIMAADAIAEFVQHVFDKEAEITAKLDELEIDSEEEIEAELQKINREYFKPAGQP